MALGTSWHSMPQVEDARLCGRRRPSSHLTLTRWRSDPFVSATRNCVPSAVIRARQEATAMAAAERLPAIYRYDEDADDLHRTFGLAFGRVPGRLRWFVECIVS